MTIREQAVGTAQLFARSPREGGYTFVTAPDYPGFSVMLAPDEDDAGLNHAFVCFLAAHNASLTAAQPLMGVPRHEDVARALREHWLTGIHCDPVAETDVATCYCSVWRSEPMPSVGAAVDAWIEHLFAALPHTGQPQEGATLQERVAHGAPNVEPPCAECGESAPALRAEIARLNEWGDGFSDAQLKERRLCEERIQEMQRTIDKCCLALMMIREGCADPAKFAGERLLALSAAPASPRAEGDHVMRISRKKLEAAARAYLLEWGYEYTGKSIIDCAESTDPKIYNPRAAKAVISARKILQAAHRPAAEQ